MKKMIVFIMLLAVTLSAQFKEGERVGLTQIKSYCTTINMVGDTTQTLYVPYPREHVSDWESMVGLTLPEYSGVHYSDNHLSTGDVFLDVTVVNTSGVTDSLYSYMLPLSLNKNLEAWHAVTNDTTFFDFVTPDVSEHAVYLDWTTAYSYGIPLSGETWPTAGLVFGFTQVDESDAAVNVLYITLWFVW